MENHLLTTGIPRSATTFVRQALSRTLSFPIIPICNTATIYQQLIPEKLFEFVASPGAISGQHMPATEFNLRFLEAAGIKRISVQLRDPRDAITSWWHHLEMASAQQQAWQRYVHYATGLVSRDYASLTAEQKLRDIVQHAYPAFQAWMKDWVRVIDTDRRFAYFILRYEDFVSNPRGAIRALLAFFGRTEAPILPSLDDGPTDGGIKLMTMFRKGEVGSYVQEAPADLIMALDAGLDGELSARFRWPKSRLP
jgi:hypothetical protein